MMKPRLVISLAFVAIILAMSGNTPTTSAATVRPPEVTPAEALQRLLEGNSRYVSGHPEHPNDRPSAAPQHPIAVILSCSDSRVPPEIIFDQGIGDVFVVRVAGNTYDKMLLETIEFGVENLGARLILVMGHDQCGAVTAAVKAYPDPHAGEMIKNIYPAVKDAKDAQGDRVSAAISINAVLVAARLAAEPQLSHLVAQGKLKILPARYEMESGRVKILGGE